MKIYYILIIIIITSCSVQKSAYEDKLILSKDLETYSFKVSEIKTKYNELGEKECVNYSKLDVDSLGFKYYGVDLDKLLSFLHNVDLKQIQFTYPVPNVILDIECRYNSKPKNFNSIIEGLLNHYSIKEDIINTEESALCLMIEDTIKLNKYTDFNCNENSHFTGNDTNLSAKKIRLNNLAKSINTYFPSLYIIADSSTNKCYSLNLNKLNSIEETEQQLKNDYGLIFKKTSINVISYKYTKLQHLYIQKESH